MTDLIVVGAGPAGLTAALYAARAGKTVKIIDAEGIGGQIAKSPLVENYPGIAKMSGMSFADNLYEQVSSLGVEFELSAVLRIEKGENGTHIVVTEDGDFESRAVILATGAKHRLLNVPGEDEFQGHGISYCALCDGAFFKGRPVAVIGGGNTALTDAIYLSAIASEVTILHRRDEFRADESLMDRARSIPNILWLPNVNIEEFQGSGNLTAIRYTDKLNGSEKLLKTDAAFIAIGQVPNNGIFNQITDLDENGYFISNESGATKFPGIFVAGDCRKKDVRQLTTAIADGANAAVAAWKYINAAVSSNS